MTLKTELYLKQLERWPKTGRHILAQFDEQSVVVYQAFRPEIARFAVEHGQPLERRAILLGLRGDTLRQYAQECNRSEPSRPGALVPSHEVLCKRRRRMVYTSAFPAPFAGYC